MAGRNAVNAETRQGHRLGTTCTHGAGADALKQRTRER